MGTRYYRPGDRRGGSKIVPTKRFFLFIGAAAAIIVVIVLLVTLVPASEKDKTINDVAESQQTETVPAAENTEETVTDENENIGAEEAVTAETAENAVDETAQAETEGAVTDETVSADSGYVSAGVTYETLQDGSSGEAVTNLQRRLIELGYLEAGNDTGKFGPMTEEALKAFQTKNNLQSDGIAGPQTQVVLYSDAAIAK